MHGTYLFLQEFLSLEFWYGSQPTGENVQEQQDASILRLGQFNGNRRDQSHGGRQFYVGKVRVVRHCRHRPLRHRCSGRHGVD